MKYSNISHLLDALVAKRIDIVMLDTFTLGPLKQTLKDKTLKIADMIDTKSGYGIVVGGLTRSLKVFYSYKFSRVLPFE